MLVQIFEHINMKTVILFLCALCIVSYEVGAQNTGILQHSCLEKLGISMRELSTVLADESKEGHRKRGCLEICYYERIGLAKDDQLNMDEINRVISQVMPPGEKTKTMLQTLNECAATATNAGNGDPCVIADMFTECGLEEFKLNIRTLIGQMNS